MTKEVKTGLIKISIGVMIALIIFVISMSPFFRIVGKYRLIEIDDMEVEEFNDAVFDDDDAVTIYLNFTLAGKIDAVHQYESDEVLLDVCRMSNIEVGEDFDIIELENQLESRVKDYLEYSKWDVEGGRIRVKIGEYNEWEDYTINGNRLEIEKEEGDILLEKEGYGIGDILRWISLFILLCQIIPAVRLMTKKPKKKVIPDLRCPYCNSRVDMYSRFCNACGNKFTEENRPKLAKLQPKCKNCGTQAVEGRDYCLNCGCRIER